MSEMVRLVPVGWVSAPDMLCKLANVFHEAAEMGGRGTSFAECEKLSAAFAAEIMQRIRPPLGGFVSVGGREFMVPSIVWGTLFDAHMKESEGSDLMSSFTTGLAVGSAFGEYRDRQLLFGFENVTAILDQISTALRLGHEPSSLGAPWEWFGNPTAWLARDESTRFANERLRASGRSETEKNRRAEFAKIIIDEHHYIFTEKSIEGIRNRSGNTIRG
ncbi:hypothetical protein [Brevundimonas sp.]|uniref:hypothetical protein n=1 Tax=Brevundimonas sp. TaxID=1871086 RepID=UPI001A262BDB|nr:hypothetical protein [Brevundimonas sp.]MBJ7484343.1 hypothetical protein [Brevundimonas sp.]